MEDSPSAKPPAEKDKLVESDYLDYSDLEARILNLSKEDLEKMYSRINSLDDPKLLFESTPNGTYAKYLDSLKVTELTLDEVRRGKLKKLRSRGNL